MALIQARELLYFTQNGDSRGYFMMMNDDDSMVLKRGFKDD